MKKISFRRFTRSLPLRLSAIITLVMLVGSVLMTSITTSLVRKNMYNDAITRTQTAMNTITNRVNFIMEQAQTEVTNVMPMVKMFVNEATQRDSLNKLTHYFVTENEWAVTAKIGFLPNAFPDTSPYCAFISYSDTTGTICDQKFTKKEDYATWGWYKQAVESRQNSWSEPFYNRTLNLMVNTFSCPIHRRNSSEIVAIWAVDVEFVKLSELVEEYQPYPKAYAYIISNEGRFMSHPNRECELKTFDQIDPKFQTEASRKIYSLMLSDNNGVEEMTINGERCLVFYRTIPTMGASMAVVCPFSDVFANADFVWRSIWDDWLIALLIAAIILFAIIYWIMRPLRGFAKAVKAVAKGNYNAPLPTIHTNDELRDFHDAMLYMQQSLSKNIRQLTETTAANARIESELRVARQIQQSLLPTQFSPFSDCPQLQLYATLQPAREVGGDLYDFFIRDNRLFFAIGDVSGKGIPASLFMAIACKVFRLVANYADSPSVIASQINQTLASQNAENMFVTMFVGVLNLENAELVFANAGHNPPLILNKNGCRYIDMQANLPLGIFDKATFAEQTLTLQPNEALLLYTDGVSEAENTEKQLFGEDNLLKFAENNCQNSPKTIVENLQTEIKHFCNGAEQSDDITMLCFRLQNVDKQTITFKNRLEETSRLLPFVEQVAKKFAIPADKTMMINLALEEVLVNVIQYGFPDGNESKIWLTAQQNDGEICFELIDSGVPFDPTAAPEIDPTASPEQRNIGGLGIFLAKQIFQKIDYLRIGNENHLVTRWSK